MKLIIESWRRFLKEDPNYFGASYIEFKTRVDAGEHPIKVAKEILEPVGKGSTRLVFGFPDNRTHLLKVINIDIIGDDEAYSEDFVNPITGFTKKHKTVSNENEADLKMQQIYPNVFPRTYEVADDYSWILAERVAPISESELAKVLKIPAEMTAKSSRKEYVEMVTLATNYMNPEKSNFSLNEAESTYQLPDKPAMPPAQTIQDDPASTPSWEEFKNQVDSSEKQVQDSRVQRIDSMARNMLTDSHNRNVFRAAALLKIPPRELTAKNFGISKFGGDHLVILDASLWEYEEEPPPLPQSSIDATGTEETYKL